MHRRGRRGVSREIRRRLSFDWLRTTYRDSDDELAIIDNDLDPKEVRNLQQNMLHLIRDLKSFVGPEGFVLEESRGAVFLLRTTSVGNSARQFLNFFVEDLKDFVGKRQRRPGLLIIDEFGTFRNQSIVDVLMLARAARIWAWCWLPRMLPVWEMSKSGA